MESFFGNSDKSVVLKTFNKHFFDFLDELIHIYPDNVEMLTGRETFQTFKKLNPTSIIKAWYSYIYQPYKVVIDAGDIDFFMEKDYTLDLNHPDVKNTKTILEMIDNVRIPIKNLSSPNRIHATKYIQNLSKLSLAYDTLTAPPRIVEQSDAR